MITIYPKEEDETNYKQNLTAYFNQDSTGQEDTNCLSFLIFGREICPTTKKLHWQGYAETKKKTTKKGLKKLFQPILGALSNTIHIQKRKGTQQQAILYTQKDGDVHSYGVQMEQGKRSDLVEVVDAIRQGATVQKLWEDFPTIMIRMNTGVTLAHARLSPRTLPNTHPIESFCWDPMTLRPQIMSQIVWGLPGIGKTSFILAAHPTVYVVSHIDDLLHFDPTRSEGLLFDDMSFTHLPRTAQIHLLDSELDRSIHCRYRTAIIPANTRKWFSTNEEGGMIFDLNDGAIKRRVNVLNLIKFD